MSGARSPRTIGRALRETAHASREQVALVFADGTPSLDYGQLEALAGRLRAATAAAPGATVALCLEDRAALAALVAAGLLAGRVVCPLNPGASAAVLSRLLDHARPALLISDSAAPAALAGANIARASAAELRDGLTHRPDARLPDDDDGGLLIYTSGTTGEPKGVLLNESQIGANVTFAIEHFGHDASCVSASVLPLFHSFTIIGDLLPMLVCGGRSLITAGVAVTAIKSTAQAFAEQRVTSYSGVPIVFDTLMAMRVSLPDTLRFAIAGAAPLSERTRARYAKTYRHPLIACYGLTETTCFATASALDDAREGVVGRPAGIEIRIVDDAAAPLPPGATGEIAMRGASVVSGGYYADDGKHRAAFTDDGWFLSGDIGRLDDDGQLRITGRKKNMLIRGGEKVYLEDVDRCLLAHPDVADCCTVQVAAGKHEDRAVAFVVPRGSALDGEALIEHVTRTLGVISRPDQVVTIEQIPRSASGKALREVLRARHQESR